MSEAKKNSLKLRRLTLLGILIALMVVMDMTGIGFIMIPPISITTLTLPVIVGAIVLGPSGGAILGGVFGLISIYKATTIGVSAMDIAFSPFKSGAPLSSLVMALGCRILFGLVAGLIFRWLSKYDKVGLLSTAVTAILGCLTHTVTVMSCLWFLFPDVQVTIKAILLSVLSVNFLIEIGVSFIFAFIFARFLPMLKKHSFA